MKTQAAAYWIALAVFGLVLHSEYRRGALPALHRVAGRAGSALCRLTTRAERAFAVATVFSQKSTLDHPLLASAYARGLAQAESDLQRQQARDQAEQLRDFARAEAAMVRTQADLERSQIDRIRWCARSQMRLSNTANRRMMVINPAGRAKTSGQVVIVDDDDADF